MGPTRHHKHHNQTPTSDDSGEDSDIQEIAIIMPGDRDGASLSSAQRASPLLKRRKSSPQMDPIPNYVAPTRSNQSIEPNSNYGHTHYTAAASDLIYPTPANNDSNRIQSPTVVPLEYPNSIFIPIATEPSYNFSNVEHTSNIHHQVQTSCPIFTPQSVSSRAAARRPSSSQIRSGSSLSKNIPRPVSSALANAVNRRRNSLAEQQQKLEKTPQLIRADPNYSVSTHYGKVPISTEYAEKPVMWSPKVPEVEQIDHRTRAKVVEEPSAADNIESISAEEYNRLQSVRPAKQRVAHKPTIPKNKQNRPKMPLGTSRKVPIAFRVKYLDVIINEYLNTGHPEQEAYDTSLKDEKALAERAASKMIYVNLVAGLKKKIREKAGVSTLPQDDDPKFVNGNKVVSHEEILTGKVRGTFSIERKRKLSDPSDLNEHDLYERLSRYLLPQDQLEAYGYPRRDLENPRLRMPPLGKDGQKLELRAVLAPSYICERCAKSYRVGEDGLPLTTNKCIFHPGHLWNERVGRSIEKRYSCCKGEHSSGGCSSNLYHVHRGEFELENYTGYVETEQRDDREPNKHGIYALDCEMSYTTYGLELTRVTVVNYKNEVIYEKLVKPHNPILDHNTKYSGIRPGDLDHVETTLHDVQRDLLRLFSSKTILIGHSLDSDMRALKLFHKTFIDTAQLFPHKRGLPYKRALRTLMTENLKVIIQEDAGHDSKEDACSAFRLVMWKAKTDVPVK